MKVCVFFLRSRVARKSAESSSMSWAPQQMEPFTIPLKVGARLNCQGARGENVGAVGPQRDSNYVIALAAAACSRSFSALPASATPRIRKDALAPGSAPE